MFNLLNCLRKAGQVIMLSYLHPDVDELATHQDPLLSPRYGWTGAKCAVDVRPPQTTFSGAVWWDGGMVGWWDGGMEGWRGGGMEGWNRKAKLGYEIDIFPRAVKFFVAKFAAVKLSDEAIDLLERIWLQLSEVEISDLSLTVGTSNQLSLILS